MSLRGEGLDIEWILVLVTRPCYDRFSKDVIVKLLSEQHAEQVKQPIS